MAVSPLNFTKLIVGDLDRSAAYYDAVFGVGELYRFEGKIAGDPFRQVILGADGEMAGGLILVRSTEHAVAAGGRIHSEPRDPKIPGVALVAFVADPDGHLAEVLEPAASPA